MNNLAVNTEDSFANLLELAANDDLEGFKKLVELDPSGIDEVGLWYCRQKGLKQMFNGHRTPLMVAATYGSIEVMKLILSLSDAYINCAAGFDKTTALHCAAAGGATNVVNAVKLLLAAGADPNLVDGSGHYPIDVIVLPPRLSNDKFILEELLKTNGYSGEGKPMVLTGILNSNSPPLKSSPRKMYSALELAFSPMNSKSNDLHISSLSEKKEYPFDPSLPDIKNSIYSTDEFRMYSFKVRPCSRAYSHDWTECPFVHPGENARRRDPRKYHYSCVPCPDFRKGSCRCGDMCEYAHGVFECWLHPAQYRTRLCKDGTSCARRVCFFAHTDEELRPLYVSTGSAVPSPRSGSSGPPVMDFASAMNIYPGSPSSMSVMSPNAFTPPMSPSSAHSSMAWPQPNVPALHLPGSNLQSSRLRSSINARDILAEDFDLLPEFDAQQQLLLNDLSCLSQINMGSNSLNHSGRMKTLTPSNLDDLFSSESLSPRYTDQALASAIFSPTHKSAVLSQFQRQQTMLSPINTNFSPKNVDHPLLQVSFGVPSGRISPRSVEPISPISSRLSMLAQREKQQQFRSLSSRELGANSFNAGGSASNSWSKLGYFDGKPTDEYGKLRRSSSFELGNNGEEPDLSWVQSLVKESPTDVTESKGTSFSGNPSNVSSTMEATDHAVLGAWIEQMQLDNLVAQQN